MMPYRVFVLLAGMTLFCVVLYASFFLMTVGSIGGTGWAIGVACAALAGRWRPLTVSPDHVVAGTAGLPRLRGNTAFPRDWAWPGYLVSQWRHDWLLAWRVGRRIITTGYDRIRSWDRDPQWIMLIYLVPLAGWTGVALGMLVGALYVLITGVVTLAIAWAGWGAVIGVLRTYDRSLRRIRKAETVCPHPQCYHKQHVPHYECSNCQCIHRDIRPGLLGAMWRRCGCDTRLPTTVLRAAQELTALCERCERPLRAGSAALTGISLPVFGPASAGKTRLMLTGLVQLHEELNASSAELEFDDESGVRMFEEGTHLIATGDNTSKTPAGQLPAATTFRVKRGRRQALVSLFDAAGEFFTDAEDNRELEFLDHSRGLVFVLDPFSIPWVQDQLGGAQDERVVAAQPATESPEDVYQVTARRLKDYNVELNRRALAIVVVKADLLTDLSWAGPLLDDRVREWLNTAGLDNLVLAAERDFATTRFFVASSVTGTRPGSALSPAEPFRWLMDRGGFPAAPANTDRPVQEKV